jgi:phosphate transport system permease protein
VRRLKDKVAISLLAFSVAIILAILVVILGNVAIHGAGAVTWEFITKPPRMGLTEGGIMPAVVGTAVLVSKGRPGRRKLFFRAMSALLATITRSAVANLAGVPSIVFGLFGLGFFIQFIGRGIDRATQPEGEVLWGQGSLLWAACTLALLTLPTVIVATEEALRTVPHDLREASLALGATRWETIRRVVLPGSLSGIMTGAILGISRGAGEVAPILFTGAAYYLPFLPGDVTDQFMHLGYHVLILSTQSPDVEATKPLLYGTVFVLLALTFLLNLAGVIIRSRTRSRSHR